MHNLFAFICSFSLTLSLSFSLSLPSTLQGFYLILNYYFFNYLRVCISQRIACIFVPAALTLDSLFFSFSFSFSFYLSLLLRPSLFCHIPFSYYCSMFLINKQRHKTCGGQPPSPHPHGWAPSLRSSHFPSGCPGEAAKLQIAKTNSKLTNFLRLWHASRNTSAGCGYCGCGPPAALASLSPLIAHLSFSLALVSPFSAHQATFLTAFI